MYCSLLTARDSSGKLKRASYLIAFNKERPSPHHMSYSELLERVQRVMVMMMISYQEA